MFLSALGRDGSQLPLNTKSPPERINQTFKANCYSTSMYSLITPYTPQSVWARKH